VDSVPINALLVEDLSVEFGGVLAVDGVSLRAEKGEILAVIGPNGAGKTTLFNIITGVTKPDRGRVCVADVDVTRKRADERAELGIGRTFQELRLFNDMSVLENVAVGALWQDGVNLAASVIGLPRARKRRAAAYDLADDLLGRIGLTHRRDIAAGLLSHGEKRLVEVARALAVRPRVLILDEPTAGLNTPNKLLFVNETLKVIRERVETILLIEHDMDIVMGISHRVVVMAHGRTIAEGTPAEIQTNPDVLREYFGS
jgi:branched-chain amino acid transport system ATP-binding protein